MLEHRKPPAPWCKAVLKLGFCLASHRTALNPEKYGAASPNVVDVTCYEGQAAGTC